MFTSAELIQAQLRRLRFSSRPQRSPGEFPPGWRAWFAVVRARAGRVTGASSDAIVAILLQRELRLPPVRMAALNRWQAFTTLWRQQWQPVGREGRGERIAAWIITGIVHVLLSLILVWLTWARFVGLPAAAGEEVVQVEFIGEGTPPEDSNAAVKRAESAAPAAIAARAPETKEPLPPASMPDEVLMPSQLPARNQPAAQPLQVTQTPRPDSDFVLAPTVPRIASLPQSKLSIPQLQDAVRPLETLELPVPVPVPVHPLRPTLPSAQISVPQLKTQVESLPESQSSLKPVQTRQFAVRQASVQVPELQAQVEELPGAAPSESEKLASSENTNPVALQSEPSQAKNTTQTTAKPTPDSGSAKSFNSAGLGDKPGVTPGTKVSSLRGDDWGVSPRDRPGGHAGKPGLFDDDGRVRLPAGNRATAGGGLPPGTVEERIDNLDRSGTWLKRPPNDYTPTRFDRFWVPNETILEEWVRRNIREVSIRIPGTSKKLHCVVSLLQLGGGCGIDDPNLSDQEAGARPPPDIPFKPELQQDQDALAKPSTAPIKDSATEDSTTNESIKP